MSTICFSLNMLKHQFSTLIICSPMGETAFPSSGHVKNPRPDSVVECKMVLLQNTALKYDLQHAAGTILLTVSVTSRILSGALLLSNQKVSETFPFVKMK